METYFWTIASILIPIYAILLGFFIILLKKKIKIEAENKQEFFDTLDKGYTNDLINEHKHIINIYKGIFTKQADNVNKLIQLLYAYRIRVIKSQRPLDSIATEVPSNSNQYILSQIDNTLEKLEKTSPFSYLNSTERLLFKEILDYCESENYQAIENKIKDISHILKVKNDTIEKLTTANKWSIPIAVIGIILTIIFGILSCLS